MIDPAALDREIRVAIVTEIRGTGAIPTAADVGARSASAPAQAEEALARLAAAGLGLVREFWRLRPK